MKVLKFAILLWLMFSFIEGKAIPQDPPVLLSASIIDLQGKVELKWSQNDPTNIVDGFRIFEWTDFFANPVYESTDGSTFEGIHDNSPANNKACVYYIISLSTTSTPGSFPNEKRCQTIFLRNIEYDECSKKFTLKWGEYLIHSSIDAYRNVDVYSIYQTESLTEPINWVNINTIPKLDLEIIDTEELYPDPAVGRTDIYSTQVDALPNTQYYYRIEAVFDDFEYNAFSNIKSYNTPVFNTPSNPQLENLTVNENNEVEISGSVTDLQYASSGKIERSDDYPFIPDYSIDLSISTSTEIAEVDSDADPDQSSYYYRISLEDQCGVEINSSEFRTIHLHAELNGDSEVNLEWNEFVGWNVDNYNIYIQRQSAPTIWTLLDHSTTSFDFKHDLSQEKPEEYVFKYRIEALEEDDRRKSYSNTVTVYRSFDMPSAFNPNSTISENTTFKPVVNYPNPNNYILEIYNRWGALIWKTENPAEGWKGENKSGKLQPMGVYVYLLQYEEPAGPLRTKRGTVTLIH